MENEVKVVLRGQFQYFFNIMEDFKVEMFEGEYNRPFIKYISLTNEQCASVETKLRQVFLIPKDRDILKWIEERKIYEDGFNAKLDSFKLKNFLDKISICPKLKVYINWSDFKDIDVLDLEDVLRYFYDIWFPGMDDIEIFDETFNWLVSIRHDGVVSYVFR